MPSGIKSAELKLNRAVKCLPTIKRCIATYSAGRPHKISVKSKGKKRVNVPKQPPYQISILVGEMDYQMRSALDHLTFELVKMNPDIAAIDPHWREHCQFPLIIRTRRQCKPPLPKADFSRFL